ncbi:Glycosyl transferase family 2 [Parelusimicrobium proximum]|uniref:glycosyltransferase family 2 protein n=1 Tax=Parelusimicrobium proximum TaxID=3228953 RepID=UPI003D16DB09
MPEISVVIPAHNVQEYILPCLRSVQKQTFADFEVLIIENNSTDNTLKLCKDFALEDSRFKVLPVKDKGVSKARNTGIDAAQGEFIAFVDGDDWLSDDYLSSLYEAVCGKSNIAVSICSYCTAHKGGRFVIPTRFNFSPRLVFREEEKVVWSGYGPAWGKLFRKALLSSNNIYFPSHIKFWEDRVMLIKALSCSGSVSVTDKGRYFYRRDNPLQVTESLDWHGKCSDLRAVSEEIRAFSAQNNNLHPYFCLLWADIMPMFIGSGWECSNIAKLNRKELKRCAEILRDEILLLERSIFSDKPLVFRVKFALFQISMRLGMSVFYLKALRIVKNLVFRPLGLTK